MANHYGLDFEAKNTVLTKKLNNVVYQLLVKSSADMIYTDEDTTLTDTLRQISEVLSNHNNSFSDVLQQISNIVGDVTAAENEIREIWNFLQSDSGEGSSLIDLLNQKVDKQEGKDLSDNNFTSELKSKLEDSYTNTEIDNKLEALEESINTHAPSDLIDRISALEQRPTLVVSDSENSEEVQNLPDGSVWFKRL